MDDRMRVRCISIVGACQKFYYSQPFRRTRQQFPRQRRLSETIL